MSFDVFFFNIWFFKKNRSFSRDTISKLVLCYCSVTTGAPLTWKIIKIQQLIFISILTMYSLETFFWQQLVCKNQSYDLSWNLQLLVLVNTVSEKQINILKSSLKNGSMGMNENNNTGMDDRWINRCMDKIDIDWCLHDKRVIAIHTAGRADFTVYCKYKTTPHSW